MTAPIFFTLSQYKIIGEDYTEERLKERITEREYIKTPAVKKRIGNVIDMNTNAKIKARALYHTFFANYGKDREKAYELYFSGKRMDSLEKVIEMECLPEIVNETGKSTNMPYLRGGECPIREVLKEISQSKIF